MINKCMQCEETIPGDAKVCPKCGHPVAEAKHAHDWKPVQPGYKPPIGKMAKFVCNKCGRVGMKTTRMHASRSQRGR